MTSREDAQRIEKNYLPHADCKPMDCTKAGVSGLAQDYIQKLDEIAALKAECAAHREALSRFITTVNPSGYDDGVKAEEAFEQALACVVADRELKAERDALLTDKERLDWLLVQGIYLRHLSRRIPRREWIDAARNAQATSQSEKQDKPQDHP